MTDLPPERREELAEALSVAAFDFTAYSETAHPDHNRWSWRGAGHGQQRRQECYEAADALAPLLARWRREDMAEGAAEALRALRALADEWEHHDTNRPYAHRLRAALDTPDPETTP